MALTDPNANLRDLLSQFQGISQGAQDTFQASNQLRQQAAQQNFNQQAPGLLSNPNQDSLNKLALLKDQTGDPSLLGSVYGTYQKVAAKKAGLDDSEDGNSFEAADFKKAYPQMTDEEAKVAENSTESDKEILSRLDKKYGTDKLDNQMALEDYKNKNKQRDKFTGYYNRFSDQVDKETNSLSAALQGLKSGTKIDDSLAVQALVKSATGSTRPVSDKQVSQYISNTFGNQAGTVANFFQNGNVSTLPPDVKATLSQALQQAINNKDQYKQRHVAELLSNASGDYPQLFEGATPDKAVLQRAKKAGLDYQVDSSGRGSFVTKPTKTEVQGAPGDGDKLTALFNDVKKIQDPSMQKAWVDKLSKWNGKVMPAPIQAQYQAALSQAIGK